MLALYTPESDFISCNRLSSGAETARHRQPWQSPDQDSLVGLGHITASRAQYRTNPAPVLPVRPRNVTTACAPKFPYSQNIAIVEPPRQHSAAAASFTSPCFLSLVSPSLLDSYQYQSSGRPNMRPILLSGHVRLCFPASIGYFFEDPTSYFFFPLGRKKKIIIG